MVDLRLDFKKEYVTWKSLAEDRLRQAHDNSVNKIASITLASTASSDIFMHVLKLAIEQLFLGYNKSYLIKLVCKLRSHEQRTPVNRLSSLT